MTDLHYDFPPSGLMPMSWDGKPAIWMAWTGTNPLPDLLALCLASVRRHNEKAFEVILVTPENIHDYIDPHPAYDLLSYAHRSDYLRLALLHEYGGAYLDMSTIALRSLVGVYADLDRYDIVTYDGRPWGEVFGNSAFGPTRRNSDLTQAWKAALDAHLDRRFDDLAAHRASDPNEHEDCLGWSEILRDITLPIAQRFVEEGRLSARLLEPTWAHFTAGGPVAHELMEVRSPEPPDTELLILTHAVMDDEVLRMRAAEILGSGLGICRLLQRALGHEVPPPGAVDPTEDESRTAPGSQTDVQLEMPKPHADVSVQPTETREIATHLNDLAIHRAIVCFVEENRTLIQQFLALRESWLYIESADTDLVVMGPGDVLSQLPDDLVKIEQRPVADDPVWRGYRYVNSIACLNGAGAERLDRYTHLLRSDADTFVTPGWNAFYPEVFIYGTGGYSNSEDVRRRIIDISKEYGLVHRGMTNVGSTWYGETALIRRTAAYTEMLTKHILTHHFAEDEGSWPGWFGGVATMYAGEIAVNHCAPDAARTDELDVSSTSDQSTSLYPHVHCWHTNNKFSKFWFADGRYGPEDFENLDIGIIRDYCMEMAQRSSRVLAGVK